MRQYQRPPRTPRIWRVFPELKSEILKLVKMGYTSRQIKKELGIENSLIDSWTKSLYALEMTYRDDPKMIRERDDLMEHIQMLKELDMGRHKDSIVANRQRDHRQRDWGFRDYEATDIKDEKCPKKSSSPSKKSPKSYADRYRVGISNSTFSRSFSIDSIAKKSASPPPKKPT